MIQTAVIAELVRATDADIPVSLPVDFLPKAILKVTRESRVIMVYRRTGHTSVV